MERLYRELQNYSHKNIYPFHMPGHKRNDASVDGEFPLDRDITEIDGFDDLHHPEGILKKAQEAVSELYGTLESFYSVNGSTAAILAAVSAAVSRGGRILMARNCHKAVYHAVCLRGLAPVYIYPPFQREFGINGGILPSHVEKALQEDPDIEAVLITSPTYDGVVSDVQRIAEIAHCRNIPLIVDEAHGAHFRFSGYFPVSAAELGADLVIQSFHKTLPSMTQTAVLHRCSDRVDRDRIRRFLGMYQSSSPSYILMASMDACADRLSRDGRRMFDVFVNRLKKTRERLSECEHIRLVPDRIAGTAGIFGLDRSKLLFSTLGSCLTGRELYRIFLEKYKLQMEMASEYYVTALTSVGDTAEGFERLCAAATEIDRMAVPSADPKHILPDVLPEIVMRGVLLPAEAMESPAEACPLEKCEGRISAEFAYLYPPGIPILVPGEQMTGQFVRNVRRYMEQGFRLQGLRDYANRTIMVVKE